MMLGKYGDGKEVLPRVLHLSIARYSRDLPKTGESLQFLVSIHEEGTGVTWQQNVTVTPETERDLLNMTQDLYLWSIKKALTPGNAKEVVHRLGRLLYETFIGKEGAKVFNAIPPSAVLMNIDETILNLPWELIYNNNNAIARQTPFGRLITSRIIPLSGRDPVKEDNVVRILAVGNPTLDLENAELEIQALKELEGKHSGYSIEVKVLEHEKATKQNFVKILTSGDYDILHFIGHGKFEPEAPETSSIRFADGLFSADDVLKLKWKAPPYLVFNSSCESGRAAGGKKLVSDKNHSNGLAAAFIASGVSAYAGYFWPVSDTGASLFAKEFYRSLFERENIGIAFLEARNFVISELGNAGDLTGFSAILYGDAASSHRRDLAMAI